MIETGATKLAENPQVFLLSNSSVVDENSFEKLYTMREL